MSEWAKFKVGTSELGNYNQACQQFESISHTSHVATALSILDREEIRPYLVFDESKLNDQRILVSWLSPNYWGVGFRYGNIRFDFDFKNLIEGKLFYWVESVAYKIPACRILVTDRNHNGELAAYDPTTKEGPWWHNTANDQHYYNGKHCIEFMFECSISLESIRTIDFVDHHPNFCSIHRTNPDRCEELGFSASKGGAMFLARAVTTDFSPKKLAPYLIQNSEYPKSNLEVAFNELLHVSRKVNFNGNLTTKSEEASAVAQGICSAYSFHQLSNAKKLASLFHTEDDCHSALAVVISKAVNLTNWKQLIDA